MKKFIYIIVLAVCLFTCVDSVKAEDMTCSYEKTNSNNNGNTITTTLTIPKNSKPLIREEAVTSMESDYSEPWYKYVTDATGLTTGVTLIREGVTFIYNFGLGGENMTGRVLSSSYLIGSKYDFIEDGKFKCPSKVRLYICNKASFDANAVVVSTYAPPKIVSLQNGSYNATGDFANENKLLKTAFGGIDANCNSNTLTPFPNKAKLISSTGEDKAKDDATLSESDTFYAGNYADVQKYNMEASVASFEQNTKTGCENILGTKTLEKIKWLVRIIRIGIPVLIVILGTGDFLSSLLSGEDKNFKEAATKFGKRLSAGVIVIFIPYIILFLINISGLTKDYNIDVDNMFCVLTK